MSSPWVNDAIPANSGGFVATTSLRVASSTPNVQNITKPSRRELRTLLKHAEPGLPCVTIYPPQPFIVEAPPLRIERPGVLLAWPIIDLETKVLRWKTKKYAEHLVENAEQAMVFPRDPSQLGWKAGGGGSWQGAASAGFDGTNDVLSSSSLQEALAHSLGLPSRLLVGKVLEEKKE